MSQIQLSLHSSFRIYAETPGGAGAKKDSRKLATVSEVATGALNAYAFALARNGSSEVINRLVDNLEYFTRSIEPVPVLPGAARPVQKDGLGVGAVED